jgi:hypothetical protein
MAKFSMSADLKTSADSVWKAIGGFNALPDWHPAIEKSELEEEGQVRRLELAGGGTVIEKLESKDDGSRTYSYSITDSPLPVANYFATIKVTGEGDDCTVEWSGEFDPAAGASMEDATAVVRGVYEIGLENLKKLYGG